MRAVVLDNEFTKALKEEGKEDLLTLMNHPMGELVENACRDFGLEIVPLSQLRGEEEEVFFISAGFPLPLEGTIHDFFEMAYTAIRDEGLEIVAYAWVKGEDNPDLLHQIRGKDLIFEDLIPLFDCQLREFRSLDFNLPHICDFSTLAMAGHAIHGEYNKRLMKAGVRIDRPFDTIIDPDVQIGKGTWIQGCVQITGKTVIGENCRITDGSNIDQSTIGDNVVIRSSIIESSTMEDGSNIGPFSHLRPHAHLGKGVHIGNFVEVKKASLGQGTKAGHLAYIGDAEVGNDVNISCGVIFCNYDGKNKHQAKVGDGAFIGSNTNLVAPVVVENEGFIAAGSTITTRVEEGSLAVERAETKIIPGYVAKRKEKGTL